MHKNTFTRTKGIYVHKSRGLCAGIMTIVNNTVLNTGNRIRGQISGSLITHTKNDTYIRITIFMLLTLTISNFYFKICSIQKIALENVKQTIFQHQCLMVPIDSKNSVPAISHHLKLSCCFIFAEPNRHLKPQNETILFCIVKLPLVKVYKRKFTLRLK